jgi:hypothetical protein
MMFARVFGSLGKRRLVVVGLTAVSLTAVVAVLAISLLSLNARPAFGSGSGGGGCLSTTGPVCTFTSTNAFADFNSVSTDLCIVTDASVQPFTSINMPGRAAIQSVVVSIFKFDNCAPNGGATLEDAVNVDFATGLPVFNGTIQLDPKLDTAAINGSAAMFDFVSGQTFTSTVTVSWQGFGPTSTFMDSSHIRSPGFMMNTRFTGSSRSAVASGVITDEAATNIATPPTSIANLMNSTGGTVQFIRS